MRNQALKALVIFSFFLSTSCFVTSQYDHYSYVETISLKVDALNLMDLATADYSINEKEARIFKINYQKLYEYEKNRPNNGRTVEMWDSLMGDKSHLLGEFLNDWKTKTTTVVFIRLKKKQIELTFDQILELEKGKVKNRKK